MALLRFTYIPPIIQPAPSLAISAPLVQTTIAPITAPPPITTAPITTAPITATPIITAPIAAPSSITLSEPIQTLPPKLITAEIIEPTMPPPIKTSPILEASKLELASKVGGLATGIDIKIPVFSSIAKAILLPAFTLNQTPINKDYAVLDNKFSAVERLGVSTVVPELLMMTRFKPLFKDGVSTRLTTPTGKEYQFEGLSPEGNYFDIQIQLRALMFENIVNFIRDMKKHPELDEHFESQRKGYKYYIEKVDKDVETLYSLIKKMDNLRNAFYLSPKRKYFLNVIASVMPSAKTAITSGGGGPYDFFLQLTGFDTVLSKFGFNTQLIENYSSTKLYLQTLYEARILAEAYSTSLLGTSQEGRPLDFDATTIKKSPKSENAVTFKTFNRVTMNIDRDKERNTNYKLVESIMTGIASTLSFKDAQKLAWLCHVLTKEYRYSKALGNDATARVLSDSYEYQVREVNANVLDNVFGNVGTSIIEFPKNPRLALASAAQMVEDNVGVLPFESRYIESAGNTYTPGSAFIVDSMLATGELNTTPLEAYVKLLNAQVVSAGKIFEQFDFFATGKGVGDALLGFLDDYLDDPTRLLTTFENSLTAASNDFVGGAVFNLAKKEPKIKSALFTYLYLKALDPSVATGGTPPAPTTTSTEPLLKIISVSSLFDPHNDDAYVGDIANLVKEKLPTNQTEGVQAIVKMTTEGLLFTDKTVLISSHEDIKAALRGGKPTMLVNKIIELFRLIARAFENNKAISGDKTKFSGITMPVMCGLLFEGLLALVDDKFKWTLSAQFDNSGTHAYTLKKRDLGILDSISAAIDGVGTAHDLIKKEKKILQESLAIILTNLITLRDVAQSTLNNIKASKGVIDNVAALLQKKELMPLLLNEAQIVLLKQQLDAIKSNVFDNFDANEDSVLAVGSSGLSLVTDDALVSSDLRKVLFDNFSFSRYLSNNGHNLKIMTVGIPWGMTKTLRDKVDIKSLSKSHRRTRQTDIIRINVFKSDMEFQDVVFKPIPFIFELTRFVPRSGLINSYKTGGNLENIANAVQTRDYSPDISENYDVTKLEHEEYSFLSAQQKRDLINNHVQSYLLELYIKFMTGVSVSENDFYVDETTIKNVKADFVTKIFGKKLLDFTLASSGVTSTALNKLGTIQPLGSMDLKTMQSVAIPSLSPLQTVKFDHFVKTVATFTNLNTVFSDGFAVAKKLLTPKVFERTFNIPVDPDDFEIDVEETFKKEAGKESFHALLAQGRIVEVGKQNSTSTFATGTRYKLRDRTKKENHLIFEKYFITVETVDEPPSDGKLLPFINLIKPIASTFDSFVPVKPAIVPTLPTSFTPVSSISTLDSLSNVTSVIGNLIKPPRVI